MNLYHLLVGDDVYRRGNQGIGLPHEAYPYADSPDMP